MGLNTPCPKHGNLHPDFLCPDKEKSKLEALLEKNAYGEGLTPGERKRAEKLIVEAELTNEDCWVCYLPKEKTIYDTGLCKSHAFCALATRK